LERDKAAFSSLPQIVSAKILGMGNSAAAQSAAPFVVMQTEGHKHGSNAANRSE
jgi:hypothetical protein